MDLVGFLASMEPAKIRAQLSRILASAAFESAERSSAFLRFIVDRALEGRTNEIKESIVAVEVLGRKTSFDSKIDPIVRVEAKRLRDRLDSFYRGEGAEDQILIALPKGGYVPQFSQREPPSVLRPSGKSSAVSYAGWALALAVLVFSWLYFHKTAEFERTFRLSILPPKNSAFESFAISPDGRTVAFTAAWKGNTALWVRPLDSLEAKPMPGTEYASQPFWSPDSRSIGFFTTSKLKTIDIAGGPTRDLADIVVGRGASWSREGIIVFAPKPDGILYRVAANGGSPQPVTSLDESRAEISHALPHFLPDGRRFLYLAASARAGGSAIRVGSLGSKTSKVLLPDADGGAAYAPPSVTRPASLLSVSGGELIAEPFDLSTLALTGNPTVIAPEVRYRRWRDPGFSLSDRGILLYQAGSPAERRFTWFNRQGKVRATIGPPNAFSAFTLSPDEQYLAAWADNDPATATTTVWLMDLSRDGALSRFSELGQGEAEFLPVWSPDSRELLFSRGDEHRMRLLRRALNGGTTRTILDSDGPKFPTDWSSDARFVAFNTQWPDYRDMHIWTLQLNTSSAPQAFAQHLYAELGASFSPAGSGEGPRWMAYTSAETGRDEVYVRDFPSAGRKWTASTAGGWMPHWSRDGHELFYLDLEGNLISVSVHAGHTPALGAPHALFATDLRPTPIQTLMNQYAVSRDGRRFLLNTRTIESSPATITAVSGW